VTGTLVWLRRDLRLADQPALQAAAARGGPVYPVYIHAPDEEAPWAPGAASCWWLHHSLHAFMQDLARIGSRLLLRKGPSLTVLETLLQQTGADAVFWNRLYEPAARARDQNVEKSLLARGYQVQTFNAALWFEPWEIASGTGEPYRVFSPFWKACQRQEWAQRVPLPTVTQLPAPVGAAANPTAVPTAVPTEDSPADSPAVPNAGGVAGNWPDTLPPEALALLPTIAWDQGLAAVWQPGEAGAQARLQAFCDQAVLHYATGREFPARPGTSRLSPHLHFGELSPRQIAMELLARGLDPQAKGVEHFLRELGWREFAYHLLVHFPQTPEQPLYRRFESFPWRVAPADLRAWQQGRTGIPIVDAAMRELWQTGWMHNRARMIVASFLTKNLRLHWLEGARWFWDTLVDADLAANTLGWQWAAGCGADAAPYFRIFNPVLQAQRFDAEGEYVRRYVPELTHLPPATLHTPWVPTRKPTPARRSAPRGTLPLPGLFPSAEQEASTGHPAMGMGPTPPVGAVYPPPIVDLQKSRQEALEAFARMRADESMADTHSQTRN
jgi:deoxyribodipyrimidine photo-lyase